MKKLFAVALLSVGMVSGAAQAGFVQTDWKVAGDKKAVLHEETGLEWLSLAETGGMSINQVKALLETTYAGWRLPTYQEIQQLAVSIYPSIEPRKELFNSTVVAGTTSEQRAVHALFGQASGVARYTYGIYDVDGKTYAFSVDGGLSRVWYSYHYANHLDWRRAYEGVYLVNDGGVTLSSIQDPTLNINNPNAPINQGGGPVADVSAPAGLFALLSGLFFFARRRG